jgi:hypothetical protein
MSKAGPEPRGKRVYREMTVALLRDRKEADAVEVAFSESARFYRLPRQHAELARILRQLREAMEKKSAVRVLVDYPEGNMIHDVRLLGSAGEEKS